MTNRSPAISLALLIAPTMCIVAVRFGIPALDEVISNDFILEASLHIVAIFVGLFMLTRYSRIEDHEYHRSNAIRRLSKTYKSEDRGLWDEKSDKALQKLESKANSSGSKANKKITKRMSGNIGSLNTEMSETEVEDGYEAEVRISGMQTFVDQEAIDETKKKQSKTSISKLLSSSLDRAETPENKKQTRKGKNEGAEEINQKELQVQDGNQSMGWFSHNIYSEVCSIMWPVWCHQ